MLRRRRQSPAPDEFSAEVLALLEPLSRTALRLTRNRADAEDLVQDTVVKALRFAESVHARARISKRGCTRSCTIPGATGGGTRSRTPWTSTATRVDEAASLPGGPAAFETPERILLRETLDARRAGGAR